MSDLTALNPDRPYQLVLSVGDAPTLDASVRVIDLTPDMDAGVAEGEEVSTSLPAHPVILRLVDSGLTPADMRARVLFYADPNLSVAVSDVVACYTAACAFANRRLDLMVGERFLAVADIDVRARALASEAPATHVPDVVQVGAAHDELSTYGVDGDLAGADIAIVRAARQLRLVPPADLLAALAQYVAVTAVRARGSVERLPRLVAGSEPAEDVTSGLYLETVRAQAAALRRTRREGDRVEAAPVELSQRSRDLLAAATVPMEAVMLALGASTPDGEVWHCPRPQRHTNGDQNPSMKISRGRARCYRCDRERVDPVRLTIDTLGCSGDDAAKFLLEDVSPKVTELLASLPTPPASEEPSDDASTVEAPAGFEEVIEAA